MIFVETKTGDRMVNFKYCAPEQKETGAEVDQRANIFALGLILNEMFTGRVPQGNRIQRSTHRCPIRAIEQEDYSSGVSG